MATSIGNGASASVSIPAGQVLTTTGTGVATIGPGPQANQQIGLQGANTLGPWDYAATVYLTGTSSLAYTVAAPIMTSPASAADLLPVATVAALQSLVSGGGSLGVFASTAALETAHPAATNAGNSAAVGAAPPYIEYVSDGVVWQRIRLAVDAVAATSLTDGARTLTAAEVGSVVDAITAGLGAGILPSARTHCQYVRALQGADAALLDLSGNQRDGALGTTLSRAECYANAAYFTTIAASATETQSWLLAAIRAFDYAAGDSLLIFFKGILPAAPAANTAFIGTSQFSSGKGFGVRYTPAGKIDAFLSNGAGGTAFPSATNKVWSDGLEHSYCLYINGSTRQFAVYSDGAYDTNPEFQALAGGAVDCNVTTGYIGVGSAIQTTTTAPANTVALQCGAFVVAHWPAGTALPTDVLGIAQHLHRHPYRQLPRSLMGGT